MLTRHETIEGGGKVGEVGLAKGRHLLGPKHLLDKTSLGEMTQTIAYSEWNKQSLMISR